MDHRHNPTGTECARRPFIRHHAHTHTASHHGPSEVRALGGPLARPGRAMAVRRMGTLVVLGFDDGPCRRTAVEHDIPRVPASAGDPVSRAPQGIPRVAAALPRLRDYPRRGLAGVDDRGEVASPLPYRVPHFSAYVPSAGCPFPAPRLWPVLPVDLLLLGVYGIVNHLRAQAGTFSGSAPTTTTFSLAGHRAATSAPTISPASWSWGSAWESARGGAGRASRPAGFLAGCYAWSPSRVSF